MVDAAFDAEYLAAGRAQARRYALGRIGVYGFLSLFALVYLLPLVMVVVTSFRELPEIMSNGLLSLPQSFTLRAWPNAWAHYCVAGACAGIQHNFYNSLIMTIPATLISTLLGAVNGYVLSKWRFPGSEALFACMTLGAFMPAQVTLMPWAYVLGNLHLANSITGLVFIHCVQGLALTTLFCRSYYLSIPDDLIKAARIDGAGFWRIFFKIVAPLSPPILIVTVIWQFTNIWNEFLYGLVFTSGSQQPVTVSLVSLASAQLNARAYDVIAASVLIGALPPLLIYLFGGKYFVRGLTQGAVK